MKKLLIGLLTMVMCFTLVGCGTKDETLPDYPDDIVEEKEEDVYSEYGESTYGEYDYNEEETDSEYGYEPYYD